MTLKVYQRVVKLNYTEYVPIQCVCAVTVIDSSGYRTLAQVEVAR